MCPARQILLLLIAAAVLTGEIGPHRDFAAKRRLLTAVFREQVADASSENHSPGLACTGRSTAITDQRPIAYRKTKRKFWAIGPQRRN